MCTYKYILYAFVPFLMMIISNSCVYSNHNYNLQSNPLIKKPGRPVGTTNKMKRNKCVCERERVMQSTKLFVDMHLNQSWFI